MSAQRSRESAIGGESSRGCRRPSTVSRVERPTAISIRGLTKRYGPIIALDALDLDVPAGSITGLLGPSGSGRTTALRMLAGLTRPSGGSAVVAGVPLGGRHGVQLRRKVGVLPDADAIFEWMSGREQLSFAAELAGVARTDIPARATSMLERVGLAVLADARTSLYDLAERRRLGMAQALIGEPEVVLLDEPVAALDPANRADLLGIIGELRDHATVVLSSPEPAHVETICDRVAVLEHGRLVVAARVDALLGGVVGATYDIVLDREPGLALAGLVARLQLEPWVSAVEVDGRVLRVAVRDEPRAVRELLPSVVATGLPIASFRRERPTLADAIGELTGGVPADAETAP
jgi:ABC-2 type transport system ATP-binding protein